VGRGVGRGGWVGTIPPKINICYVTTKNVATWVIWASHIRALVGGYALCVGG
jgi:hypothetical protein